MPDDPTASARQSQLPGVLVIETLNELNQRRLRHKPAPTNLDAAELSGTDQLECSGTSNAKTFVNGQVEVPAGGQVKVPTPCGDS
jgi:hypothetical protein